MKKKMNKRKTNALITTLIMGGVVSVLSVNDVKAEQIDLLNNDNIKKEEKESNLNAAAKKTLNKVNLTSSLNNTMSKVKESQADLDLAVKPVVPVKASIKESHEVNEKPVEKKVEVKKETPKETVKVVKEEVKTESKVDGLIASANKLKGIKYVWGGTTTSGFDCSGFTQYVFKQNGITLPRTSAEQSKVGTTISKKSDLKAGDLVFFATSGVKNKVSHVGMYIGGNKFIHASTSKGIAVSDINDPYYWGSKFLHGKRVGGVN